MSAIHGKRFLYVFLASVFFCIGFVPKKAMAVSDFSASPSVTSVSFSWTPDPIYTSTEISLESVGVVCDVSTSSCNASGLEMGSQYSFSARSYRTNSGTKEYEDSTENTTVLTHLGGTLRADRIFGSSPGPGPYLVTHQLNVAAGVTLSISGAEFQFTQSSGIGVGGSLVADNAVFTSDNPIKEQGQWNFIEFSIGSSGVFRHVVIEAAGSNISNNRYGIIIHKDALLTIENSEIRIIGNPNNRFGNDYTSDGIWVSGELTLINSKIHNIEGAGVSIRGGSIARIEHNQFSNTLEPIRAWYSTTFPLIRDNTYTNNGANAVVTSGNIATSGTWYDPVLLADNSSIGVGTTLTITPGTTVMVRKLLPGSEASLKVFGTLFAEGTAEERIIFTSDKPIKAQGQWGFIDFLSGSSGIMRHVILEAAGTDLSHNRYGIRAIDATLTIENSEIRIVGNPYDSFGDFKSDGIWVSGGDVTIKNTVFEDIEGFAVNNTSSNIISTFNNWWGHEGGPNDQSDDRATGGWYNPNPDGLSVSDRVQYDPFLTVNPNDVTITVTSPNTSTTYQPGDTPIITWSTTSADPGDAMIFSMKRDSFDHLTEPDGVNWFQFPGTTLNDGTEQITIPPNLAEAEDWRFFIRHTASDVFDAGDQTLTYTIPVVDTIPPVITLIGSNPQAVPVGNTYVEAGATAIDDPGEMDISSQIVIHSSTLNTDVAGTYMVTYNVSDVAGNAAVEVQRTVVVEPVIQVPIVTNIIIDATSENRMLQRNPLFVDFTCETDIPLDSGVQYEWEFKDSKGSVVGGLSTANNTTSFTFDDESYSPKSYSVSCKVSGVPPGTKKETFTIPIDSDGDALPDVWEMYGLDINDDGEVDLALNQDPFNANPQRRNIFVEVDWMLDVFHTHVPIFGVQNIIDAFDNMDVTLFVDIDESIREVESILFSTIGPGSSDDFHDLKLGNPENPCGTGRNDAHFGTRNDRKHANCLNRIEARRQVFRYGIFGHSLFDSKATGEAELKGNDFFISLGLTLNIYSIFDDSEEATFMHELGHTLGLEHGGGDSINCKPNYLSVMNYSFQLPYVVPDRPLDYSHDKRDTLNELNLNEPFGIGLAGFSAGLSFPYGDNNIGNIGISGSAVNWDRVGGADGLGITANINHYDGFCYQGPQNQYREHQYLHGYNDWDNLVYNFRDQPGFANGVSIDIEYTEELTWDDAIETAKAFDFDGDGFSNFDDNCPADHNSDQKDRNEDGTGDQCEEDEPHNMTFCTSDFEQSKSQRGAHRFEFTGGKYETIVITLAAERDGFYHGKNIKVFIKDKEGIEYTKQVEDSLALSFDMVLPTKGKYDMRISNLKDKKNQTDYCVTLHSSRNAYKSFERVKIP